MTVSLFKIMTPISFSENIWQIRIMEWIAMNKTYIWWMLLCFTAVVNIMIWLGAIVMRMDVNDFSYSQPILSGIYVMVCAFRSFYPRIDLERYCLFDTPISSIVVGRSLATIAETCFSIQCALLIYDLGLLLDSSAITLVAYTIVPIIVLAQAFCWHATLTLNHFWHSMEEAAWVVMVVLAAGCFAVGFVELGGIYQILMGVGLLSCLGSAYIMLFLDIPMYFSRTRDGLSTSTNYLNIEDGIQDALKRRVQTSDWQVWKKEVLWITPYFTFGVWLSIGMVLVNFK